MSKLMTVRLITNYSFKLMSNCVAGIADIISAISFDKTGNFLASGDRAGRVVLFERNYSVTLCAGCHCSNFFIETIL